MDAFVVGPFTERQVDWTHDYLKRNYPTRTKEAFIVTSLVHFFYNCKSTVYISVLIE